jgi:hypothetical protein
MGRRRWIDAVRERLSLLAPGRGGWARLAWCIRQQRALTGRAGKVVWVRAAELGWATWGAGHGLFAIERMDGLAYLHMPERAARGRR